MKAVACLVGLCLLAGIVSADYAWENGKSYRYMVNTRALTGITEFNNKYAGLEMTYTQVVHPMGGDMVNIKTENLTITEVNEQLEKGWRQGQIDQGRKADIKSELKQFVTSPMNMKVVKGVVESIQVEGNLPTWAVNIKRAQASTFTADTTGKNVVVEGNLNRKTNSVRPEQANQESGFFYKVVEETVHGECEVYYTVSQNGPFDYPYQFQKDSQAARQSRQGGGSGQGSSSSSSSSSSESKSQSQEQGQHRQQFKSQKGGPSSSSSSSSSEEGSIKQGHVRQQYRSQKGGRPSSSSSSSSSEEGSVERPWPKAFHNLCEQNDQIYEIIKTINFTTCRQKPILSFSSPSELNYHPGDNAGGSLWARALVTRLLACGQSRQNYTILKITQQEQIQSGLQDKEKVIAGAQKNVTLISIENGHPTPVQNPQTINNLVYKFDAQEQEQRKQGKLKMGKFQGTQSHKSENGLIRWSLNKLFGKKAQRSSSSSEEQQQHVGRQSSSRENNSVEDMGRGYSRQPPQSSGQTSQSSEGPSSEENNGQNSGEQGQQHGKLRQPSLDEAPLASMLTTPLDRQGIKQRAEALTKEIVADLVTHREAVDDSIASRETLSKVATLVKAIRILDHEQIHELVHKWEKGPDEEQYNLGKQILAEALAIAGTNPALKEVFELIKAGQLKGEKAAIVIATLPLYVRTPTQELLNLMFELLEDSYIKQQVQTRTSAVLAFTTLVHQACVNKKIKNTRYPVALYGEFCSPQLAQQKYAPYFVNKLKQHLQQNQQQDKHMIFVYFQALSNLGVPEVIPVVQKALDEQSEPIIKVHAIYALQKLLQSRDNLNQHQHDQQEQQILSADRLSYDVVTDKIVEKHVLPILVSAAFDRGEHPEVRVAALDSLFYCSYADTTLWQQIAMSTWFEQSRDVRAFISNTLQSLAQLHQPLKGSRWTQVLRARQVINLAKPIDASIARSNNVFTSRFFHPVNSGFAQQLQYTASADSLIPNNIYYKNYFQFGNGAAGVNPLEVSLNGQTISKLAYAAYQGLQQSGQQQQQQQGNEQLSKIRELLGITSRQQEDPVVGSLFINLRNEMQRLWTFDEQSVEQLAQQLVRKALQSGEQKISFQKLAFLGEQFASMPTILGIPVVYRVHMPSLFSVRGKVQVSNPSGPEVQVQADLSPVYAWKLHRQLAFKCPLTGKKYQSGVHRQFVVELPVSIVARKAARGEMQLAITPNHLGQATPKGTIDLVTYSQKPYTAIVHDEFYPVSIPRGGRMEVVRVDQTQQDQYSQTRTFGQKSFGLQFEMIEKSDYPEERENVSGWVQFFRQFHSTNCAFNAAWLGSPSIRFAQRKLVLNLGKSETNTIVLVAGAKYQRKLVSQQFSSQSQESGQQGSSSSESQEQQQFVDVPSRQQHSKQQRQQNKRQSQSQSGSQSQSNSGSQSQENQGQTGQQINQGSKQNVIAIALLGKKDALVPLEGNNVHQGQVVQHYSAEQYNPREQYGSQEQGQRQSNSQEQGQRQSNSQEQGQSQSNSQEQGQRQSNSREQGQRQSNSQEQGQRQSNSQEQGQRQSNSQEQGQSQSNSQEQNQSGQQQSNSQEGGNQQQGGLQRPLQKGSRTTVQYLLDVTQSTQGKLTVRLALGEAANQAAKSLSQSKSLQGVREAIAGSPNGQRQPKACVEFQGAFNIPKHASRHMLVHERRSLLAEPLAVEVQAKLQAGKSCESMPMFVKVQGKLQRDQEMTEYAQSKSLKAQRCTADEKKGFHVSQVCLEVAREQAAALNELNLHIEHSKMPAVVKNVTAKLETLVKAMGYLYLSENQQPQSPVQQNQIKLWARMTPNKQFVSIHISQLQSILKFENIKTNQVVRTILPPTATNTIVGNVQRRLLRSQLHPTCQVQGKYVNTFDNVTYSFNTKTVEDCQTLLVKDCSGRYPMAVYVKNIQKQGGKVVTILLGKQTKITLVPVGGSASSESQISSKSAGKSGSLRTSEPSSGALVNGQYVELPHVIYAEGSRNAEPIAEIMRLPNYNSIQVIGRHIKVAFNGFSTVLSVHELLRNRTCGICGDMDNEKVADLRSPRDVPLSSGSLLVASYSFELQNISGGKGKGSFQRKCNINQKYQRQVQVEEERFVSQSSSQYSSKNQKHGQQYILQQQQYHQQQQEQMQMLTNGIPRKFGPKGFSFGDSSGESQVQGTIQGLFNRFVHPGRKNTQQDYQESQNQQYPFSGNTPDAHIQYTTVPTRAARPLYFPKRVHQQDSLIQGNTPEAHDFYITTPTPSARLYSSQQIVYQQRSIRNPENSEEICFTVNKIPRCATGSPPKKMVQKLTQAYCTPQGPKAQQIQEQIEAGQHYDFSSKSQKKIRIAVPQQCGQY